VALIRDLNALCFKDGHLSSRSAWVYFNRAAAADRRGTRTNGRAALQGCSAERRRSPAGPARFEWRPRCPQARPEVGLRGRKLLSHKSSCLKCILVAVVAASKRAEKRCLHPGAAKVPVAATGGTSGLTTGAASASGAGPATAMIGAGCCGAAVVMAPAVAVAFAGGA
jgi:hypothetical protein